MIGVQTFQHRLRVLAPKSNNFPPMPVRHTTRLTDNAEAAEIWRRVGEYGNQHRWYSRNFSDVADPEKLAFLEAAPTARFWLCPPPPVHGEVIASRNILIVTDPTDVTDVLEIGCSHDYVRRDTILATVDRYVCRHCPHSYDIDHGD